MGVFVPARSRLPLGGPIVTTSQVYPEFDRLVEKRLSGRTTQNASGVVSEEIIEELRKHAFDNMPVRLILVPEKKLVNRNEIVDHITSKMAIVDDSLIEEMAAKISDVSKSNMLSKARSRADEEEDVREDPWKAIYQFLFQKFARYAILSHTWLPTGEITYEDAHKLKDWSSLEGPGFKKLEGFCKATRDHNITLAWIDTLCINKESSAELDEAIQSMYKWYQNSSICITYLRHTTSLPDMKSDNWFRRGWTLQELIAPKKMRFYDCNWMRLTSDIGDNDKINPMIQEIIFEVTGIGEEDLVSFNPLKGSDVPTRMRWAASRKTTRGEDRAYSLMGIFGVNFSISYGEGAERAFFRLIEAIISSRHTSHIIPVLHWARKAVSDTIHTSRLIPSGPECYLEGTSGAAELNLIPSVSENRQTSSQDSTLYPTLTDPMVLTHLGLRVRLLLLQMDDVEIRGPPSKSEQQFDGFFNIKLTFQTGVFKESSVLLHKRFPGVPGTVRELLQFYGTRDQKLATPWSFCFGIFTFEEDDDADIVHLPFTAAAFLLSIPKPHPMFTVQDVTSRHLTPTCKVDTYEVIRLSIDNPDPRFLAKSGRWSNSYVSLVKGSLPQMGMKLVNAYL